MPLHDEPALNPAQREVLELLGAPRTERPEFDAGLRDELRAELEEALAPTMAEVAPSTGDGADEPLFVSKYPLARVHTCEGLFLAEQDAPFAWSPQLATGRVAHKAIELAVNWRGDPVPRDLVDEAMARLTDAESNMADWLQTLSDAEQAELRAFATEKVSAFCESFPPLQARWRPVTEAAVRVELLGGAVVLSGKVDLTLGTPEGLVAGKVLIDAKTGARRPHHVDDLRFYALLETLVRGTPPRLVATVYLDQGRPQAEVVTVDVLTAALHRTVDAVRAMAELRAGTREPRLHPGPPCRWCPAADDCEPGRAWLADADGDGPLGMGEP